MADVRGVAREYAVRDRIDREVLPHQRAALQGGVVGGGHEAQAVTRKPAVGTELGNAVYHAGEAALAAVGLQ